MKTLVPIITLMVIALLFAPAIEADEVSINKSAYEDAIDEEIAQCRQMASLMTSRSSNLRKKGYREASMAMYLETNRDELVVDMMKLNLEPKEYKVERYLNDRFSNTSYTDWEAK